MRLFSVSVGVIVSGIIRLHGVGMSIEYTAGAEMQQWWVMPILKKNTREAFFQIRDPLSRQCSTYTS